MQNLVPNASFETIDGKVRAEGAIEETGNWFSPTEEAAEIFSSDFKIDPIRTPLNSFGKETPKTGNNYAGFVAYSYKDKGARSYVSTELASPLVAGETYCISFYVSHADLSKYAVSEVGAVVSVNEIMGSSANVLENDRVLTSTVGSPSMRTLYWEKIFSRFTAEGGERFLTIGNFSNSKNIVVKKVKTPPDFTRATQLPMAFYYLDDVELKKILPDDKTCDCQKKKQGKAPVIVRQTVTSQAENPSDLEEKIYGIIVPFKENSLELETEANAILNSLVIQMQLEKDIKLICIGHVNMAEAKEGNAVLAGERAEKVYSWLIEKGIPKERLEKRKGKDYERVGKPTDDNYEAENRSVVFEFF